ncbi:MAG: hypothetical protein CM1200mP29_02540 [Verrucomicrobiota bacterium]|nr:MAG: hypothetical protein CM1200mP29_02540 [Verrucomicrobiota bacterium]
MVTYGANNGTLPQTSSGFFWVVPDLADEFLAAASRFLEVADALG